MTPYMSILVMDEEVESMIRRVNVLLSPVSLEAFLQATVTPYIKERAQHRFDTEGDDVSGKWKPLSQATIDARRAAGFPPGPINVRTGALEEYITNSVAQPWAGSQSASITYPQSRPMGNLRKKVLGAQQGEGRAPARPVLGVNEADLAATVSMLEAYIRGDTL